MGKVDSEELGSPNAENRREHFEAGFAIFPSGFPCVVGNDEPGASYRWMGWPEAVLADAWGGSCGEGTGCGKRALRVG